MLFVVEDRGGKEKRKEGGRGGWRVGSKDSGVQGQARLDHFEVPRSAFEGASEPILRSEFMRLVRIQSTQMPVPVMVIRAARTSI